MTSRKMVSILLCCVSSMLLTCGCDLDNFRKSVLVDTNKTVENEEPTEEVKNIEPMEEKPVIYLYGYENEEVNVKLDLDGEFTCTYPKYDEEKGWKVTAKKDGTLVDTKKKTYNYLYWEGKLNTTYDFSEGFCIRGQDVATWLEKELKVLGLSTREANEFIVYWLPRMQNNTYNVISFQTKAYTDKAKLTVDPAPDRTFRVFMAWYPSSEPVAIEPQKFKVPNRMGKCVVEWGGAQVDPSSHKELGGSLYSGSGITDEVIIEGLSARDEVQTQSILAQTVYRKQVIQAQQAQAALTQNGGNPTAQVATQPQGHPFTDKNGQKTVFTDAEWKKLISVWAYTGQAEELIGHHTISELRQVLNSR